MVTFLKRGKMAGEKRKFTRILFRVKAQLELGDRVFSVDEIFNLSVGGCFLAIKEPAVVGTRCNVRIFLSGTVETLSILISGEIVRIESGGLAIKFTRIEPDGLFHLQNIIRYNSPDADVIDEEIAAHPGLI